MDYVPLSQRNVIGFDTETTGKSPYEDHILSYALIYDNVGTHKEKVLKPPSGVIISEEATAVHGISQEQAEAGEDRVEALTELWEEMVQLSSDGHVFAGHNLAYDMTILGHECERVGIEDAIKTINSSFVIIDTMLLLYEQFRFQMGLKLNQVAITLGVDAELLDNAHNAAADAIVSVALLPKVDLLLPHLAVMDNDELMKLQSQMYREKAFLFVKNGSEEPTTGFPAARVLTAKSKKQSTRKKRNTDA